MCPLPSHKSSGPMGSKSKSVLMTVAPWDPEALAAFDSPDMVTGPRGKAGHSWPEKDRNSLCALPNLSDSRDRENPLRLLSGDNGWRPPCTQQQLQTLGPWPEAPGMSPLAFRPALPTLQHSRQCLCFVPYTSEIFVCDETFRLFSVFLEMRHLRKTENKEHVCPWRQWESWRDLGPGSRS